jgi:hypothetical protein
MGMFKRLISVGILGSLSGCVAKEEVPVAPLDGGGFVTSGGSSSSFGPVPSFAGTATGGGVFPGQAPVSGAVFEAAHAPAPVSGGTLLVLKDQTTAVVSDPDRDQVIMVDLEAFAVTHTLALDVGSEPGRAAEDASGQVHVVLRGTGKLLTLDPKAGTVLGTRDVCRYPRGLAAADAEQVVHIACAEGRLVTLSTAAASATPQRDVALDRDLRDVVLAPDGLWVSLFRSAEILRLDASGQVQSRYTLPGRTSGFGASKANVAWRMIPRPGGGVIVVHQRAFLGEVAPQPGGYGSIGGGGIIEPTISEISEDGTVVSAGAMLQSSLPVDVAFSPISQEFLIAAAAAQHPDQPSFMPPAVLVAQSGLELQSAPQDPVSFLFGDEEYQAALPNSPIVAAAFVNDVPLLQLTKPSSLVLGSRGLSLPGNDVTDTGSELFHLQTGSGLACASCHPEGLEDGHVWTFAGVGPRRTQAIRGGLLGTEPFHWDGLETDFQALTNDVMASRMGGPLLRPDQATAMARYIDRLPALVLPTVAATEVVARGKALFEDEKVGCATCHSGARFTNNATVDVGKGPLQVPGLLGLWARAPYMHDGCAKTLADRFSPACHDSAHGDISGLTTEDLGALSAYLETL